MILPITMSGAGAAALINFWLAMRCGQARTKENVMVGDGGNDLVMRRMRAHADFIEYTPIVLILILLVEMAKGTSTWLWAVMALYMLGRIAHAFGMDGWMKGRMIGTMLAMLSMIGLGLYVVAIPHLSAGQVDAVDTEVLPQG
jgi:uncharacterized protein